MKVVINYFLALFIVTSLISCESNLDIGEIYFQSNEYEQALLKLKKIPKNSEDFSKARKLIYKIDSIQSYRERINDSISRLRIMKEDSISFRTAKYHLKNNDLDDALGYLNSISSYNKELNEKKYKLYDQIRKKRENNRNNKKVEEKNDARKIIRIKRARAFSPNSVGGVSFEILWQNRSKKTVKYAFFTVIPYNAVGDVVKCDITDNSSFRAKVTGPIKPYAWYGNGSVWSNAWYNSSISKIKITKINIRYMDGTTDNLFSTYINYATY